MCHAMSNYTVCGGRGELYKSHPLYIPFRLLTLLDNTCKYFCTFIVCGYVGEEMFGCHHYTVDLHTLKKQERQPSVVIREGTM